MHSYPCSGSGWYVTSSYVSGGIEYAQLSGAFASATDAATNFAASIAALDLACCQLSFSEIFEHPRTRIEDAIYFYNLIAYGEPCNCETEELFLSFVAGGEGIIDQLSQSRGVREQMLVETDATIVSELHTQYTSLMSSSYHTMLSIVGGAS